MPSFSYSGVTFSGQSLTGVAKARDLSALASRLREEGVLLLEATPAAGRFAAIRLPFQGQFAGNVTRFFRHLATLIGAGVPLSKALDGLAARAQGPGWRSALQEVAATVREGASLSQALAKHERVFSGVAMPLTAAGEASGNLAEILERIADHREKAESLARKVRGAMV